MNYWIAKRVSITSYHLEKTSILHTRPRLGQSCGRGGIKKKCQFLYAPFSIIEGKFVDTALFFNFLNANILTVAVPDNPTNSIHEAVCSILSGVLSPLSAQGAIISRIPLLTPKYHFIQTLYRQPWLFYQPTSENP